MCEDHCRFELTVMPWSIVVVAVSSVDPSKWYSLLVLVFFLEMLRVLHFDVLTLIDQSLLHLERQAKSCWRDTASDGCWITLYSFESSANRAICESCWIYVGMSLMYTRNKSGPRVDPCGTPDKTFSQSE